MCDSCTCGSNTSTDVTIGSAAPSAVGTFTVVGMTCGHCVSSVSGEVGKISGVTSVDVDLTSGAVKVGSDAPIDRELVRAAVEEAGYELAPS